MEISFKRLTEIKRSEIIELMNNQLVRREMPLLVGDFRQNDCDKFIAAKESLWLEHGYGPWAFIVNGQFAGWGGLQPEEGEADLALVLHPDYWGIGKVLYRKFINTAFDEMGLKSVTVLFPPSRTRINGFLRLGFKRDCELMVGNKRFIKYKLERYSGCENMTKKTKQKSPRNEIARALICRGGRTITTLCKYFNLNNVREQFQLGSPFILISVETFRTH